MPGQAEFAKSWALERRFDPAMTTADRATRYGAWRRAVQATITAA
jgi:glycerol kinase